MSKPTYYYSQKISLNFTKTSKHPNSRTTALFVYETQLTIIQLDNLGRIPRKCPKPRILPGPVEVSRISCTLSRVLLTVDTITQRCKEKLNTLAISVMNQWPGVKLRVTEGWDEEGKHATDSLHYEGRAVDVTTSDRDRSKDIGLSTREDCLEFLTVWLVSRGGVFSRGSNRLADGDTAVHGSDYLIEPDRIPSESSSAAKSGGCFPGRSLVRTEDGSTKRLDQVQLGDRIAALDSSGDIVYSEVIAFLDRSLTERRQFVQLTTESGRVLTLTPAHLVPVEGRSSVFAGRVQPGDKILVKDPADENEVEHRLRWDKVVDNRLVLEEGIYAPLTTEGTVLIDDVVASCYAFVDNQEVAHIAFLPYRMWSSVKSFFERRLPGLEDSRYPDVRQDSRTGQEGILCEEDVLVFVAAKRTVKRVRLSPVATWPRVEARECQRTRKILEAWEVGCTCTGRREIGRYASMS
ncbi:Sonic hedgehog protein A [Eufriesea mexicana]|nr:Sonic hedgehog protein A [Eufriesea mexicana]